MRRAGVACLVAACSTGAVSTPVNENTGAETKTRLRPHVWSADGVELLRWFYDSKRKEDCAFIDNGIAHTGPGPTYWCLPRNSVTHDATGGLAIFSDARCSAPLALANPEVAAAYVIVRGANSCAEPLRVFRAAPAQTVTPYVFDGTKCAPATASVATHALGDEIPLDAFVSAGEVASPLGGPIARLELVGSDGSRQTIGGFDEARRFAVAASDPAAKGDFRWFPTRLAFEAAGTILYRDAACKTTAPTKVARDALCPLGASFLFDGMCGEGTFYARGEALNVATLYEKSPLGVCVPSNDEAGVVAYERGAELSREAFVAAAKAERGDGRIHLRGWAEGTRPVMWTDFFDSNIGETCTPDEGRCLPGGSASVTLWADASCTRPAFEEPDDGCGKKPIPKWVRSEGKAYSVKGEVAPLYERERAGDACKKHEPVVPSHGFEVEAVEMGRFAVVTETTR
jgi:hypothetical protein